MSVVVDANIVAALVLPLPYSDQSRSRMDAWERDHVDLVAPMLLEYEVSSALRKAVTIGWLSQDEVDEALQRLLNLDIECWPPTPEQHSSALRWAERLGQSKTYDSYYLALAEQQRADLWTADRRLAHRARQLHITWIHWIGE